MQCLFFLADLTDTDKFSSYNFGHDESEVPLGAMNIPSKPAPVAYTAPHEGPITLSVLLRCCLPPCPATLSPNCPFFSSKAPQIFKQAAPQAWRFLTTAFLKPSFLLVGTSLHSEPSSNHTTYGAPCLTHHFLYALSIFHSYYIIYLEGSCLHPQVCCELQKSRRGIMFTLLSPVP